jgi:glycerol-3-phosphate dehydrogenase
MREDCDVLVIGAGVIGSSIARELSKYKLNVVVLEKEVDVAQGASGKNSGVVHAGFDPLPGSLKARLNVEGNEVFPKLCKDLAVPFKRIGKFVVAKEKDEIEDLKVLMNRGKANGVMGLEIISGDELREREPNIIGYSALFSSTSGITSPYLLNIALAENALQNGVRIIFNTKVIGIQRKNAHYLIRTNRIIFRTHWVINASGIWSDRVARMVGVNEYRLYPCRGEYYVLDKRMRGLVTSMIYPVPPKESGGKGIHITPTVDGNILLGPSAEYIKSKEDVRTTSVVIEKIYNEVNKLCPKIQKNDFIASYAGLRAKLLPPSQPGFTDFIIEEKPRNFINLIGIESPGLTAAPAIAKMVTTMIDQKEKLEKNREFNPIRRGIIRFDNAPLIERERLIKENPDYGEVICRCEKVTRAEIIQAIQNPLGVKTLSGIKLRTRSMMGRCQGGYCLPKIINIFKEMYPDEEITLKGEDSPILFGDMRKA